MKWEFLYMHTNSESNALLHDVLLNAADFLNKSADEFEKDTKYSVINFFCAIELFLKARLIAEHWSLIVGKKPNLKNFKSGCSSTLQFDELIYVLKNAFEEPQIADEDIDSFDIIRQERNRLMHFCHSINSSDPIELKEIKAKLAIKILQAWYRLRALLSTWNGITKKSNMVINSMLRFEAKIVRLKNYYKIRYEAIKKDIEKDKKENQIQYRVCSNCHQEALRITWSNKKDISYANCVVCGNSFKERLITITCPKCGMSVSVNAYKIKSGAPVSLSCNHKLDFRTFLECVNNRYLEETKIILDTLDFPEEKTDIINCSYCGNRDSVAYINGAFTCVKCGMGSAVISKCGWCNELQLGGNLINSYLDGCEFCSGRGYDD